MFQKIFNMKIKHLLLTLFAMTVWFISCKKENGSLDNSGPKLSLQNLSSDKAFRKYLSNDSLMFSAMFLSSKQKVNPELEKMQINNEDDFRRYLSKRGFNADSIISLLNENTRLLSGIKKSYNLDLESNAKLFNNVYDTLFKKSMTKSTVKLSMTLKATLKNSLLMSTPEGTFPYDTGPVPTDPIATQCLNDFIDKWNTNARNYRKNAEACIALPGAFGTACTYLAYKALDRQQQVAYAEYHACRWPSSSDVVFPDTTEAIVPELGVTDELFQEVDPAFLDNTPYIYSYYKSHLRDGRPSPLPGIAYVVTIDGFSYYNDSTNTLRKLPDGYYVSQSDFFAGDYTYRYVKMGVSQFVGKSTFDPSYPYETIDWLLYNPFQ